MTALDLLVQVDPWMSATAQLADYVIPPQLWLEVPGTSQILDWLTRNGTGYGQMEPYANYSPAVADPPPGSDLIEEWEFFYELAREMDVVEIRNEHAPSWALSSLTRTCVRASCR